MPSTSLAELIRLFQAHLKIYVICRNTGFHTSRGLSSTTSSHAKCMQQLERDMTSFTGGGDGENSPLTLQTTPRALAAGERNASSDDDGEDVSDLPAEEAQSAVGVSITREQSRYASPKTPAAEKAAAIERAGGFFGHTSSIAEATLVEEPEEDVGDEDEDVLHERDAPTALRGPDSQRQIPPPQPNIPERSPRRTPVRLPSPWRADASSQWYQGTQARAGLFDGLFNRKRSSTGPDTPTRSFLSSLPSLPKPFSLGSTSSSVTDDNAKLRTDSAEASKRSSAQLLCFAPDDETSSPDEENARHATYEVSASPTSEHNVRSRAALLRRSASDQSLVTQRTLSRVESLGDDSRFEHVQDQVNSRLKAIKDSWQDSSMKLPSLPNIKMPNFTSDFIRDRSGSLNKRASVSLPYSTQPNGREAASKMETRPVDPMTRQPYSSTKAAMADVSPGKTSNHPNFKRALQHLEGDVVVLGGYRGSILRSADPPHRQLWVPVKVGLNLRKADLQVDFDADGDERARDRIIADGMLTHIGPVDIARRLFKRLRSCKNAQSGKLRVHDYGYDWRLDPSYLSRQLISFLEKLPCNRPGVSKDKNGATVIAHSLGGIITRHAVNARPELFKGVVYAGVPTTCVNILGPMRNGDEVLLSNRVLTAQVNFSIRTSFVLLPLDGRCFFNKQTREVGISYPSCEEMLMLTTPRNILLTSSTPRHG